MMKGLRGCEEDEETARWRKYWGLILNAILFILTPAS
jgi:hypothetical protein